MKQLSYPKSFGTRFRQLLWLNLLIGVFLAIIFAVFQYKSADHNLTNGLISSLIHSAIYGLMFGLGVPYLGDRLIIMRAPWNWTVILVSLFLIAVFSTGLVEISLLGLGALTPENFRQEFLFKSFGVFFTALIVSLCIYFYEKFRDQIQTINLQLRTHELEKERALKLVTEARLASLESRLHPHFLFNTLNSISALISEDPRLADKMVQRLASLLRASLDACEYDEVPLSHEIKLVTDYLEIEKTRFRERLIYSIAIEPEIESLHIPPLILQPIVENSVKFAVAPSLARGEIKISARLEKNDLILEVWDNGAGFTAEMIPKGHGLDNLQSRLSALFGEAAELFVSSADQGTTVGISLPLNGAAQER